MPVIDKYTEAERRPVVTPGWEREKNGDSGVTMNGSGLSFLDGGNVLMLDCGDICTAL